MVLLITENWKVTLFQTGFLTFWDCILKDPNQDKVHMKTLKVYLTYEGFCDVSSKAEIIDLNALWENLSWKII